MFFLAKLFSAKGVGSTQLAGKSSKYRVSFYWFRPKSSKFGSGSTQGRKMTGSANVWHNFEEFKKFQWVSGGEWTNAQRAFLL